MEKFTPTPLRGFVIGSIIYLLGIYFESHPVGHVLMRVQYEVPGEDYAPIPDISVVLHTQGTFAWDAPIPFMPALAIEIQSPAQSDREMTDKAGYYLKHGAQMVWLLYPDRKLVEVLTPTDRRLLTTDQTLDGGTLLPGFSADVRGLFP
ncbi:MAG: Uma2 family endonuclease [Chloroflexota bacterium]|nr:Uma2 family endonuclease [Chloroflexota bacterium]